MTLTTTLLQATLRANPGYELIPLDRLPAEKRALFTTAAGSTDLYGVLCPRDGFALSPQLVYCATALLFLTLQAPGSLPLYVRNGLDESSTGEIAKAILDGIFEVENGREFVSGAAACRLLSAALPAVGDLHPLERISIEALKYAQALSAADVSVLSARLYNYNQIPITARWRQRLPDREAVAAYLKLDPEGKNRPSRKHWRYQEPERHEYWRYFKSRRNRRAPLESAKTYRNCKLYISPSCEAFPDAFATAVRILSESRVDAFKVGADTPALFRPDKMVAYFSSHADMQEAASQLAGSLQGCPAQGVPFTAALDDAGLLSWGEDPPHYEPSALEEAPGSWRTWVTIRLASAILSAKIGVRTEGDPEPWEYALQRVRMEGVDTTTWTPSASIWNRYVER